MNSAPPEQAALTVFSAWDRDPAGRGVAGAVSLGRELGRRLGLEPFSIDEPGPAGESSADPLEAARPGLRALAARYEELLAASRIPVTAFSRCPAALATLPVVAKHHPEAAILWFDAHPDLNTPDTSATGYFGGLSLAGPMGRWDSGLGQGVAARNVILVGARDIDPPEKHFIGERLIKVVAPGPGLPARLSAAIGGRPVYVHFDCDVLEPGIVPLDYEVPGGLDLGDLRAAAEVIGKHELTGIEIGEFEAPQEGGSQPGPLVESFWPALSRFAA